jgi:hypothetical protein
MNFLIFLIVKEAAMEDNSLTSGCTRLRTLSNSAFTSEIAEQQLIMRGGSQTWAALDICELTIYFLIT